MVKRRKEGRQEGQKKERIQTMSDKAPIKGRKGSAGRNFYSLIPGNESTKLVIK
jgi:hypothetical protein